jgi:hypothetical protein
MTCLRLALLVCWAVPGPLHSALAETPSVTIPTAADTPANDLPAGPGSPGIKARAEVHVPSLANLFREWQRSKTGAFSTDLWNILVEVSENTPQGMDRDELTGVVERIREWPDTSMHVATFAPDTEGRKRWAVRLDWPIRDLHERVDLILNSDAAQDMLRGVTMKETPGGGYAIRLPESDFAFIIPVGGSRSIIASHADLTVSAETPRPAGEAEGGSGPLLTCRLNLTPTEQDSGATFLSGFSALTAVTYSGQVNPDGEWTETIQIDWPPISGMGVKVFINRVKQSYFVPGEAFFAGVFNSSLAPSMLESMAGFGPQVMFGEGGLEVVGEESLGPVASRLDPEVCLIVLPGKGFLPAPDIIIQTRSRKPATFAGDIRKAVEEVNKVYRERDQKEPWKETTVRDRTVFWRDGAGQQVGFLNPLSMNPVLFMTRESDARGKERDHLVLAWTSTSPEALVRRWLDLPRNKERRHLPAGSKTSGELWVNWQQVYRWTHPYLDLALNASAVRSLLPRFDAVSDRLSDSTIALDLKYTGLAAAHRGPVPLGCVAVPALLAGSFAEDSGGASDLSRERYASRRLRVLYHHSRLFQKDIGRWPAEIQELDGYIDFDGNPHLMHLQLSSGKQWSKWLEGLFEAPKEKPDDEEEVDPRFENNLYVINWARDSWSLGYAPNTFEHLETLYIDQDGVIHRKERKLERKPALTDASHDSKPPAEDSAPNEASKEQEP